MTGRPKKTDYIQVRVDPEFKRNLEKAAWARQLDASDIVREAVSDFLFRNPIPQHYAQMGMINGS